ncbi:MAG: hypothetical protein ACC645_20090 [Pirellulales bacterium]
MNASHVDITFECLPLRRVGRLDAPIDASPEYHARRRRIQRAIERHGVDHTYYLVNAHATYHLANSQVIGMLRFGFEGTVFTDANDCHTEQVDLKVRLVGDTCDWLTGAARDWWFETVRRAVIIEFDRYIASGSLAQTARRSDQVASSDNGTSGDLGSDV